MHGHDKDRLIVSAVVGTVLYVILFIFLNPLDWLERQRFSEPFGPLVVEFDMLPFSEEDPVVRDDPEEPEPIEEQEPEPVEPEPDLQPAKQAPDPVPTKTASTPAPTFKLAPNLDNTVSTTGSSLRAERGEAVATVSDTGTERLKVPEPGDQSGSSGVEYDPESLVPRDDKEVAESTTEETPSFFNQEQRDAISNIKTTPTETREVVREDTSETPKQTEFESLEDLTQNREPASTLARPVIPESVKTGGRTRYEVIVSFLITDGGAVTDIKFERPPDNQELAINIRAALQRWTFVPASQSVTVRLKYVVEVK